MSLEKRLAMLEQFNTAPAWDTKRESVIETLGHSVLCAIERRGKLTNQTLLEELQLRADSFPLPEEAETSLHALAFIEQLLSISPDEP